MGYYADMYVIQKTRSKKIVIDFLNYFLPHRAESADEYLIPEYSTQPIQEFDNANDLMSFLEKNENYSSSIYWRNLDEENLNKHGMVFYNEDGSTIFGISRDVNIDGEFTTKNEEECLAELKSYFATELGYIDYENPPDDSYDEFIEKVKKFDNLKMK